VTVHTSGTAAFPETLGRFDIGASSELLLFLFLTALTGSAALIETRRLGVSRRMLATPTTPGTIVAGEAAGRLAVALLQGALIMVGSAVIFGVNWGNPLAATALMVAFALVASGAGLLMGATARTSQQSLAFGLLLSLGLGALGGTMMPLDLFPPTMRTIAHLTPHAWAVDGFATLVRHGGGVLDILPQLGVLLATGVALLALASWRLRRSIPG
jgi:ABC-2 type transport system permease protein